jgi:hypothetical protein
VHDLVLWAELGAVVVDLASLEVAGCEDGGWETLIAGSSFPSSFLFKLSLKVHTATHIHFSPLHLNVSLNQTLPI